MLKTQNGSSILEALFIIVIGGVVVLGIWSAWQAQKSSDDDPSKNRQAASQDCRSQPKDGSLVVRFNSEVEKNRVLSIIANTGGKIRTAYEGFFAYLIEVPAGREIELAKYLNGYPEIISASPPNPESCPK